MALTHGSSLGNVAQAPLERGPSLHWRGVGHMGAGGLA
eukprot:CAMPEP_0198598620 /NCGR_PEP_ID=MMETSP1462-20131121/145907_1 /TAXON_ID=1333877 /ORGANISM="Brandtodinium nutriculum, Strain RCC3387" /LENGTH=37 /DNA_ID= /DNA_START= /DNA_END= /DNA_ORIENTATION=